MGVQWRKENPNPRVHRSSGKLLLERVDPRVGIFLSPMDTHGGFYLSCYSVAVHKAVRIFLHTPVKKIE